MSDTKLNEADSKAFIEALLAPPAETSYIPGNVAPLRARIAELEAQVERAADDAVALVGTCDVQRKRIAELEAQLAASDDWRESLRRQLENRNMQLSEAEMQAERDAKRADANAADYSAERRAHLATQRAFTAAVVTLENIHDSTDNPGELYRIRQYFGHFEEQVIAARAAVAKADGKGARP